MNDIPSTKLDDGFALGVSSSVHGSDDLIPILLENLFLRSEEIVLGHLGGELIVNLESSFGVQEEGRESALMRRFREAGNDGGGETVVSVASVFTRIALNAHVDDICGEGHGQRGGELGLKGVQNDRMLIYALRRAA